MRQLVWIGPSVLALAALGGVYAQQRRVERLEVRLKGEATTGGGPAGEIALLSARVAQLERAAAFRPGAGAPTTGAAPGAAPPPPTPEPQMRQLREDVDALLTGEASATDQGKARLRALISETQQQQWAERQVHRDERVLQQLTEAAHLNSRQREDLGKALEAERTQRRELMATARAGQGGPQDLRPALQALRVQTDQKARALLDDEQYAQYTAARTPARGPRDRGAAEAPPARP